MTSNRRLHRIAAFTAVSVLFGLTSTVSALANQHASAPQPAPVAATTVRDATEHVTLTVPTPVATSVATVPAAVPTPAQAAKAVASAPVPSRTTAATPKPKPTTKPSPTRATTRTAAAKVITAPAVRTISSYVDAPGSQAAIDSCKLVLWTHSPLWLAGHNWCGWAWMAFLPNGTIVKVTQGAAAGTFVVTGQLRLSRQSGALPAVNADLVLQTCVGSGTGLTLLRRV